LKDTQVRRQTTIRCQQELHCLWFAVTVPSISIAASISIISIGHFNNGGRAAVFPANSISEEEGVGTFLVRKPRGEQIGEEKREN
jgi:hypothetical protein